MLAAISSRAGVAAGGRAGQPLVSVGVRAVFAFELVGAAGGDLGGVGFAPDGLGAQAGGGGDQRLGKAGQYQLSSTKTAPWLLAWMPSWSIG